MNPFDAKALLDVEGASRRRQAFLAAIDPELAAREDSLPATLQAMNASARSKVRRVYALMDEFSRVRSNFVACGKGCADCCRMNISITKVEAVQLGRRTGRKIADLSRPIEHPHSKFMGVSCPFLQDDSCTVYDDRPLACRKHASHFETNAACAPEMALSVQAPIVSFSGIDQAFLMASLERGQFIRADIRDFFPEPRVEVCDTNV